MNTSEFVDVPVFARIEQLRNERLGSSVGEALSVC
jgi:hypothetical protein